MYLGRLLYTSTVMLLLTLLLTALLGCGQKGALYLPQNSEPIQNKETVQNKEPGAGHSAPTIKPNDLIRSKYQA